MRHNSSLALLDIPDLPIDAFRHIGDRKIKPQGVTKFVENAVTSTVKTVGQAVGQVAKGDLGGAVTTIGGGIDKAVNTGIPGGWPTLAVIGAGALASGALTGAAAGTAGAAEAGVIGASPVVTGYAGTVPVTMANAGGLLSGTTGLNLAASAAI